MSVATPVLERRIEDTQEEVRYSYNSRQMNDEIHNSRIKDIYKQLINPETKMSDFRPAAPVQQAPEQFAQVVTSVQQVQIAAPVQTEARFVDGARTDSELFRADSAINRKVTFVQAEAQPILKIQQTVVEEENEDLMPTRTTMQYNAENKETDVEGTVVNTSAQKRVHLTKRDKVVIAVVVAVIVALFALIIVNSAIISNVNNDLSTLQTSLKAARKTYEQVSNELADYESNFDETLRALADSLGMVK